MIHKSRNRPDLLKDAEVRPDREAALDPGKMQETCLPRLFLMRHVIETSQ